MPEQPTPGRCVLALLLGKSGKARPIVPGFVPGYRALAGPCDGRGGRRRQVAQVAHVPQYGVRRFAFQGGWHARPGQSYKPKTDD